MTLREQVAQTVESLSESELRQVAEYLAFLRYRARAKAVATLDVARIGALYAEFADEDRELAEAGMSDYRLQLAAEDSH